MKCIESDIAHSWVNCVSLVSGKLKHALFIKTSKLSCILPLKSITSLKLHTLCEIQSFETQVLSFIELFLKSERRRRRRRRSWRRQRIPTILKYVWQNSFTSFQSFLAKTEMQKVCSLCLLIMINIKCTKLTINCPQNFFCEESSIITST